MQFDGLFLCLSKLMELELEALKFRDRDKSLIMKKERKQSNYEARRELEKSVLRIIERECTTLANLGNDHEFISKKYIFIGTRSFVEVQNKVMRAYAQSKRYHTILESRYS